MANQEQLDILKQGVEAWNRWWHKNSFIDVDLSGVDLSGGDLSNVVLTGANLNEANLCGANLRGAFLVNASLWGANLSKSNLSKAHISGAKLAMANLSEADLSGADLSYSNFDHADFSRAILVEAKLSDTDCHGIYLMGANLSQADLHGAILTGADLYGATLIEANLYRTSLIRVNLKDANLTGCKIYGISAWDVDLEGATQSNLVITPDSEPIVTVDNLKIAQFIYLLLNNKEIRDVIDTTAKKAVLILGRFTPERKAVLDTLREALRTYGYLPILFDFEKPSSRDLTETITILAHMACFIIADLTEPSSIPKELEAIVPTLAVPVQPLLEGSTRPYAMFKDYWKYHWVLEVYRYNELEDLLASLKEHVIEPAERKAKELAKLRAHEFEKQ
jgi:uncharacterized protein YjbI with pentapeptide repeats